MVMGLFEKVNAGAVASDVHGSSGREQNKCCGCVTLKTISTKLHKLMVDRLSLTIL